MINPKIITHYQELEKLLTGIGFVCRPGDRAPAPIESGSPSCELLGNVNPLLKGYHVLVSVEEGLFHVYFYNDVDYRYDLWSKLQGHVDETRLRDLIVQASSLDEIRKRYPVLR